MKDYIANVERKAEEQENKENEIRKQEKMTKQKEIEELILLYGKRNNKTEVETDKKEEVLKELMDQYGKQRKNKLNLIEKYKTELLSVPSNTEKKVSPRKLSPSYKAQIVKEESIEKQEELEEDKNTFTKQSKRPRPTTLKLKVNHNLDQTECPPVNV